MRGFFYIQCMNAHRKENLSTQLLLIVIVMMVVLNFPLLSIANKPILIAGIPVLYWYVFVWWGTIVMLSAIVVHRKFNA